MVTPLVAHVHAHIQRCEKAIFLLLSLPAHGGYNIHDLVSLGSKSGRMEAVPRSS